MSWLGVPFLIDVNDIVTSSSLYINQIPKIELDSVFDWRTLIAPILSAVIPAAIAAYAIMQQNRTIKSERETQKNIATETIRAQIIASGRQEWINKFSDIMSEFISLIEPLIDARKELALHFSYLDSISKQGQDTLLKNKNVSEAFTCGVNDLKDRHKTHYEVRQQINARLSRLKMMMNPQEESCIKITEIMDAIINDVYDCKYENKEELSALLLKVKSSVTMLTKETQAFLKLEWDRVKNVEL
ncbi:hypothetical protein [Serratia sp. MYb239]|uniref:hypothetical protein n=1 Tax=Serratia sp. MYb239 TaxID=2033438 RepID=UPI00131A2FAA|nr:hypothetical protein [Serratia sp. MYb239]